MKKKSYRSDCRHFTGDRPCRFKRDCGHCGSYSPMGRRILIIKFASAGDVLRTAALLPPLKRKYPASHITWLTRPPSQELLEENPYIDRLVVYGLESVLGLQAERFDLVLSLDKAPEAAAMAMSVSAKEKLGFGLDSRGKIYPLSREAEYAFRLGLDDELKFRQNRKTYQEVICGVCRLDYSHEGYALQVGAQEKERAARLLKELGIEEGATLIGINTGAGRVFANKQMRPQRLIELIRMLRAATGAPILLLGGPLEKELNPSLARSAGAGVYDSGCGHSLKGFAAIVERCGLIITADTLALHIAVALKKPTVALFGPTCAQEIDLYGLGKKIVTTAGCAPCYKGICSLEVTCMDQVNLEDVVAASQELLGRKDA